jgi:uncharacterized protein
MPNESFDIAGPLGRLEALLMSPDQVARAAAVLCHAHPLYGGMMHFKLLFRAAKALQEQGLAVLRFNFRGVGRSEGAYDHGIGEQDDARAAVVEMGRRFPALALVVGGFSFGALVALKVGAKDGRAAALLSMGLPVADPAQLLFLADCRKPRLFIQGEHDAFVSGARVSGIVAGLPEPRSLTIVPGADHFFTGQLDALQAAVGAWAGSEPWQAGATAP